MAIIDNVSQGLMLADLVTVIASLDIVAPEVDR
jgi:NADH:ubiquinone oxidoreductase subunit D